ncbi:GGDEF domain-containing protein [Bacillus luteolus]|uniref:GGDEF domain-containing protein n=1 Tax=Litchfieldia luteola TaxID=682179 RepID=A0ABR9QE11_9BACI|nr:sensor domain-containing diguanylate cyclase [Cytobacillus luteolus]MBE4906728.1 GGDEF domain-containing protein [Cytobacillus luteolus]MBP1940622.1 diguanylate cyclase (GGDEF)-like protein [Cytobacillus luteolus]
MKRIKYNRKFKLTTLLTSLVSASVILTIIILLGASYQSEKRSLTNTYLSLNGSKSEKISRSVDSLFKSMRLSLVETTNYLAKNSELSDEDIQEQLELLRNNSRYFNSLSWIDETGLIRNIAPLSVGLKGEKVTGITRDVLDLKVPTLTKPYIAPSGRLIVLMSEPLFDSNGNYRGIIGGSIYLQERNVLNEILGNDIIGEDGSYYYVVGPGGKLLFHPYTNRIGEDVIANPMVRKVIQGQSGVQRVTNTQGISMLAAYNHIPETGWGVIQQTPVSYINELLKKHTKQLMLYALSPFLFLLFLSVLLARKLAKPFHYLADLVNQLASGEQVLTLEKNSHWNREADLLTKSVLIAIDSVQKNNTKLTEEAMTDPLTELPNIRKFQEVLERFKNEEKSFSLVLIDIDHFKAVNDNFGHKAGDEVLKYMAKMVSSLIRDSDVFFRYGGEEFVLLLPDINSSEAYEIAERIRIKVSKRNTPIGEPITISLGIADYPQATRSLNDLFRFADKALYKSKNEGRNRTTIWFIGS